MGGLVVQNGILKLEKKDLKKIKYLLMFGTPSKGLNIANFRIAKMLKSQIKNLGSASDFITKLRNDWNKKFNGWNLTMGLRTEYTTVEQFYESEFTLVLNNYLDYFRIAKVIISGMIQILCLPSIVREYSRCLFLYKRIICEHQLMSIRSSNG